MVCENDPSLIKYVLDSAVLELSISLRILGTMPPAPGSFGGEAPDRPSAKADGATDSVQASAIRTNARANR
jgi:hypothetical protein